MQSVRSGLTGCRPCGQGMCARVHHAVSVFHSLSQSCRGACRRRTPTIAELRRSRLAVRVVGSPPASRTLRKMLRVAWSEQARNGDVGGAGGAHAPATFAPGPPIASGIAVNAGLSATIGSARGAACVQQTRSQRKPSSRPRNMPRVAQPAARTGAGAEQQAPPSPVADAARST
jgi:hypothetical protein